MKVFKATCIVFMFTIFVATAVTLIPHLMLVKSIYDLGVFGIHIMMCIATLTALYIMLKEIEEDKKNE